MYAIAGHINDNMIVTDENLSSYEGYDVVITVLDTRDNTLNSQAPSERNIKAANRLAGLWENHNDDMHVDDVVVKGSIVKEGTSKNGTGVDIIYDYQGKYFTFVGAGSNGFIVTAFPIG